MSRALILAALTATLTIADATPAFAQKSPVRLFNGKDLSGWTPVFDREDAKGDETWTVADGVLKCSGTPIGYILSKDEYHDYILTLEWRWPVPVQRANSGVLVHCSTPRALGVWPKSIEVQLADGNAGEFWVIGTELKVPDEATRKLDRRHKNLITGAERPFGEWNRMEIDCKGDVVRVKVNDKLVNEATNCSAAKGRIGLQSEGVPIEFREIVLTPRGE